MNIVYFVDWVFWPPIQGAHHPALSHLDNLIKSGLAFKCFVLVQSHDEHRVPAFLKRFQNVDIRLIRVRELGEKLAAAYTMLRQHKHTFRSLITANCVALKHPGLRKELSQADILFTNLVCSVPLLKHAPPHSVSIVQTHDVLANQPTYQPGAFNQRERSPAPIEKRANRERHFREEISFLNRFDSVIAIAGDEAELMARNLPEGKVTYIPPIVVPQAPLVKPSDRQYDLLFVGSYHPPNVWSILEFYRGCFVPYLKPRGVTLALAGTVGELSGIEDDRVIQLGFVENIADAYRAARIVICPISCGAGCNIKVLEALTYGKAIVASPQAIRGLNVDSSRLLAASDPKNFARHVATLLADPVLLAEHEQRSLDLVRVGHSPQRHDWLVQRVLSRALCELEERLSSATPRGQSHGLNRKR